MLQSFNPTASREENLFLYRRSGKENSKECPNLPLNLQVEVTSKCGLSFRMCNIYHDNGSGITIGDALLGKTFELAQTATNVNPFGLGEPLLHPTIGGVVGKYKSLGASVGFTANGMLLSEEVSRALIISGLDHLQISIDSADAVAFSQIRKKADLGRICDYIKSLNRMKESLNSRNPTLGAKRCGTTR